MVEGCEDCEKWAAYGGGGMLEAHLRSEHSAESGASV
jgi:hypothetical protein